MHLWIEMLHDFLPKIRLHLPFWVEYSISGKFWVVRSFGSLADRHLLREMPGRGQASPLQYYELACEGCVWEEHIGNN